MASSKEIEEHDRYLNRLLKTQERLQNVPLGAFTVGELPALARLLGLVSNSAGEVRPRGDDLDVIDRVIARSTRETVQSENVVLTTELETRLMKLMQVTGQLSARRRLRSWEKATMNRLVKKGLAVELPSKGGKDRLWEIQGDWELVTGGFRKRS